MEQTECSIPRVYVFNVPPRSSSSGHRAADWPKDSLWSGRLRLVTSGEKIAILLEHTDKEGLFARCPVDSKATVEQVTDSSRYFVIKVNDGQGHSAYLGVAFAKKEEAWDFKVALQTAQNRNAADKTATEYFASKPSVDMSLPADGSIEVDLVGKFAKKKPAADAAAGTASAAAAAPAPAAGSSSGGGPTIVAAEGKKGGFALAPPKASDKKGRKAAHAAATGAAANTTASASASASTAAPAPAKAAGGKSAAAPAAPKAAVALDNDATLLEAFGAAPPPSSVAPAADPLAFFSSGK